MFLSKALYRWNPYICDVGLAEDKESESFGWLKMGHLQCHPF